MLESDEMGLRGGRRGFSGESHLKAMERHRRLRCVQISGEHDTPQLLVRFQAALPDPLLGLKVIERQDIQKKACCPLGLPPDLALRAYSPHLP